MQGTVMKKNKATMGLRQKVQTNTKMENVRISMGTNCRYAHVIFIIIDEKEMFDSHSTKICITERQMEMSNGNKLK